MESPSGSATVTALAGPAAAGSEDAMRQFLRFTYEENGQDLIEYGLLAGLISVLAVVAISAVGTRLQGSYQNIQASVP
jgi:pilus assembly protein Flp/PilA